MKTNMDKQVTAFCANCQNETPHSVDADNNLEVVLSCLCDNGDDHDNGGNCNRFIKLPKGTTKEQMDAYLAAHKEDNSGQMSKEKVLKTLLGDSTPTDTSPKKAPITEGELVE